MFPKKYVKEHGICVIKREHEDIETLLKRFKKKVMNSGIQKEFKESTFYEKPSVQKKRKSNEARKRLIRDQIRMEKRIKSKHKGKEREDVKNEDRRTK